MRTAGPFCNNSRFGSRKGLADVALGHGDGGAGWLCHTAVERAQTEPADPFFLRDLCALHPWFRPLCGLALSEIIVHFQE